MRRLILMRHAKAEPRAGGSDDFDRPLTKRGRRDAAVVAGALAQNGLIPDLALVSTARRATETWIAAREVFSGAKAELAPELYEAAPADIRAAVRGVGDKADTVIVVGHNPGLQEIAVQLMLEASSSSGEVQRLVQGLPTAAAVAFRFEPDGRSAFEGLYLASEGRS